METPFTGTTRSAWRSLPVAAWLGVAARRAHEGVGRRQPRAWADRRAAADWKSRYAATPASAAGRFVHARTGGQRPYRIPAAALRIILRDAHQRGTRSSGCDPPASFVSRGLQSAWSRISWRRVVVGLPIAVGAPTNPSPQERNHSRESAQRSRCVLACGIELHVYSSL
jgi:hypothetical protein